MHEQLVDVVKVRAARDAFAAIRADGSVAGCQVATTFHCSICPCSIWSDQLLPSSQISRPFFNRCKSNAEKDDLVSEVVTWGNAGTGGACTLQLREVQEISATCEAFAALRQDGSVVTWGRADWGGDSSQVSEQLREVQQAMPEWV